MSKTTPANQLYPFELISNGDFNPPNPPGGSYVSTLSLDGWTLGTGKAPVIPAEIISGQGNYAGMPTLAAGHNIFDTEASPGATIISQFVQTGANQPMHLSFDAFYQTFGNATPNHTNMADSLEVQISGDGIGVRTLDYSFAELFGTAKTGGLPAAGSSAHVDLDFTGATSGNTNISFHEIGPGAATGNIGVGLTAISVHSYSEFNGVHY